MKYIFDIFDHLIEALEDENIDPMVIDMVNDAKEALSETLDEETEE